jgi:predicted dehydrogenase
MQRKYKWGILAPGKMSAKFTRGLQLLDRAELFAVASRDAARAAAFAGEFGFMKSFGSYEELAADPDVDIIYIASPHSHHAEHALMCLRNKKAVVCEKAFTLNSRDAEMVIAEAAQQNIFLMEALWPPFQPVYIKAKQVLAGGAPGKILHLDAKFSFKAPRDNNDRKFNLALGVAHCSTSGYTR